MHRLQKLFIAFVTTILLSVLFVSQTSANNGFSDLDHRHWANNYIEDLVNVEILQGFTDGTFRPDDSVLRSHSGLMVARALEIDLDSVITVHDFKDVAENSVGYEAIQALTEKNVFAAVDYFHPSRNLTRGEMAKIVSEAFELSESNASDFNDIEGHWSESYVDTLVASGITEGYPDGTFRPDTYVSRAQLSAFIQRAMIETGTEFPEIERSKEEDIVLGVLEATNEARAAHGVAPLKRHKDLEEVAMVKAEDFVINDYFGHTSPEYGSFGNMIRDFGVSYSTGGENLATNYYSIDDVISAWMASAGHRQNMLNDRFTHLGVGYYEHNGRNYYVQMFIKP